MPDKKKEAAPPPSFDYFSKEFVIGFIIFCVIFAGAFMTRIFNIVQDQNSGMIVFPPTGNITTGMTVVNRKDITVRALPGGVALGRQDARTFGTIAEGPKTEAGTRWWRINYNEAPDGWVDESSVTSVVWLFIILNILPYALALLSPIGVTLSVILLVFYVYLTVKDNAIPPVNKKEEDAFLLSQEASRPVSRAKADFAAEGPVVNERWLHIENLIKSHNVSDWRQAIIEADIILDEMLEKIGYDGASVAEKLKNVEEGDFVNIEQAWEAHKVRNKIAHRGSDFTLSRGEAERIIGLYRQVFHEFYYI